MFSHSKVCVCVCVCVITKYLYECFIFIMIHIINAFPESLSSTEVEFCIHKAVKANFVAHQLCLSLEKIIICICE